MLNARFSRRTFDTWVPREHNPPTVEVVAMCAKVSLLFLFFAALASGQAVAVAEVSGTITDPSGGALPNAQVTMTETGKRLSRSTTTDVTGYYLLTNLPVGPYNLAVSAQGFRDYVVPGIVLQV